MGRRRNNVQALQRKVKQARHTQEIRKTKARGWECPWCHGFGSMFTKVQGSGKLLLIGCGNCKLGEMLPKHPAWKAVDLYHFVLDNARQGKIPVFKFTGLTFDQHEYLREHITLGKIIVEKEVE